MREFDEMLLREQAITSGRREAAETARSASSSAGSSGSGSDPGGTQASSSTERSSEPAEGSQRQGSEPTASAGGGRTRTKGSGASAAPPDVGDGSDDDVVARQLREAAEQEEDPELREKLWQEYRDYKKGTGGKSEDSAAEEDSGGAKDGGD